MSNTLTQDPSAATATEEKKTTEYVVLREVAGALTIAGTYEVPVGRADKAKAEALKQLASDNPEIQSFTVVAVPAKSWQPETFRLTVPEPTFTKA